jgi:HD-like signal output (HDOD) protein
MQIANSNSHPDLKQTLARMQLAALPQSAIRILELSRDQAAGPAEYAAPIEADPGLAGQVLKYVNSSYFGFARKIPSVKAGITLVGIKAIRNFALWNAVFSLAPNPRCGPFDLKSVWQDSLRRALFARAIAKAHGLKNAEEIFTAALLQDMAIPLLAKEFPGVYEKLLAARDQGRQRLSSLEESSFGWTHAQAAAEMVRQWHLPEEFASLIEGHAGGGPSAQRVGNSSAAGRSLTAADLGRDIVALSAMLPAAADPLWIECAAWEQNLGLLCPSADAPNELLEQVDGEFAEFAPVLKLSRPRKQLVECHHEAMVAS